ncbi:CBS domain-containing protein [Haloferax sp. S1W]|uniref:CBS domain-containing protein n=1 Tax=Haloferax sp. S1W TaxID=3377110 RepID=UPI0037CAFE8F
MRVDEAMTDEVVTVDEATTVSDCARAMLTNGTGSVVVTVDDDPAGIVTESDILWAGVAMDDCLSGIPTRTVMSHPIKWIRPTATVRTAAERMREEEVKKLVVVSDSEMVGIITVSDIGYHVSDVARGVTDAMGLKKRWESDRRFR